MVEIPKELIRLITNECCMKLKDNNSNTTTNNKNIITVKSIRRWGWMDGWMDRE